MLIAWPEVAIRVQNGTRMQASALESRRFPAVNLIRISMHL